MQQQQLFSPSSGSVTTPKRVKNLYNIVPTNSKDYAAEQQIETEQPASDAEAVAVRHVESKIQELKLIKEYLLTQCAIADERMQQLDIRPLLESGETTERKHDRAISHLMYLKDGSMLAQLQAMSSQSLDETSSQLNNLKSRYKLLHLENSAIKEETIRMVVGIGLEQKAARAAASAEKNDNLSTMTTRDSEESLPASSQTAKPEDMNQIQNER